jgi:hypothetical protein
MITVDKKKMKLIEELYIRGRKSNVSTIFISQSFHAIPKLIRLNANYIMLKSINSVKEFRLIASNYNLDLAPKELFDLYKSATKDKKDVFMIDVETTIPAMRYRKNYSAIKL